MTDNLTERLHAQSERLPAAVRPPVQVRQSAEHDRLIRRAVTGAVAGSVVLVLALVGGLAHATFATLRPTQVPTTQGPSASPSEAALFTLAPDALLTEADWGSLTGGGDQRAVRTQEAPPRLLKCITDPRSPGAPESQAATYLQPGLGSEVRLNEYVLRYDETDSAMLHFAELYGDIAGCWTQDDPTYDVNYTLTGERPMYGRGPIDEQFYAERVYAERPRYSITVGRDRNVVIVIESLDGWSDRPGRSLEQAMQRAIPSGRERCDLTTEMSCNFG